jgi:hypothetical protein
MDFNDVPGNGGKISDIWPCLWLCEGMWDKDRGGRDKSELFSLARAPGDTVIQSAHRNLPLLCRHL